MPTAPPILNRRRIPAAARGLIIAAVSWMTSGSMALGGEETLKVIDAWVPATDRVGADVPLLLTIRNEADAADALLRVRCSVANFSERHTVDRGEGAAAMRIIPSIALAGGSATVLKPDGYHVMLLQTRQPLSGWRTVYVLNRLPEGGNDRNGGERPQTSLKAAEGQNNLTKKLLTCGASGYAGASATRSHQ